MKLGRKGQYILEYSILIAIVAGALIAMSVYMQRAVQGQTKLIGDELSEDSEDWQPRDARDEVIE